MLVLIKTLLTHQRQMAEILRAQIPSEQTSQELSAMRKELRELKELMLSHSLSLDTNVDALRRKIDTVEKQRESTR